MDWLLKNYSFVVIGFNAIFGLIIFALHKTYAKRDDVQNIEKRLSITEKEISDTDIHKVELQLNELKGQFDGMNKLLSRAANQLDMLVENELKGSQ